MCEKLKDFQLSILGLFIALGLIISALSVTDTMSKDNVSVTGSAFEIVKSDSADWSFNVTVKKPTRIEAFKQLKNIQPAIYKYLSDNGISVEKIDTQPATSYETYKTTPSGSRTDEIAFYTFEQTYKIQSNDVEKIKKLSNSITELTEQGIDIASFNPEYQYSQISELKVKLLEQATLDAKKRAQAMLKANKNNVGEVRSIRMGVFQITPPSSNSVSDYGINDATTIDKKVTAVANVVFAIK